MKPVAEIEACRASHRCLLEGLAPLTDDDFRSPSLLPRYSRGHVVTHLTNKARAHVEVFGGPAKGEIRRLHRAGYDPDAAADAGAGRPASELVTELERSLRSLESAWDSLEDAMWERRGIMMAGPRTMAEIVAHHLRNVEVHHVDLDIGYRPSDWPPVFIAGELGRRLGTLPDRVDHADLLAWLLDRAPAPQLEHW